MNRKPWLIISLLAAVFLAACTPAVPSALDSDAENSAETTATPTETTGASSSAETASSKADTPTNSPQPTRNYDDLEIVTLLPRDAIPAIDNPEFWTVEEAEGRYAPDELVIGVEFDGDARAYSIPFLSGHEIVNDTVGGRKIAVTW